MTGHVGAVTSTPGVTPGSATAALLGREADHNSTLFAQNNAFVRGSGTYLYDADGREYLDFMTGIGVASIGHANPRLTAALTAQAGRLIVGPQSQGNDVRADLLDRLTALAGAPLARAFLSNSGSEANEAAIKWARAATGRNKIVAAKRGFAGRTLGALGLTWEAGYRRPFEPLPAEVEFVTFGDAAALEAAVNDTVAAVVLEPVQGEGGVHVAPAGYLQLARELTARHGALLVFDEVQCGVGRTGAFLAAHGFGVVPDMVTLAKGLAGGVPIGATLMTDSVARSMPRGGHGSTFGGNPLACAAALSVLDELKERELLANAAGMGERLRNGLVALDSSRVRTVRGLGLMVGLELKERVGPVIARLRDAGLVTVAAGATVIRFLPPLTVSADEVDRALEIVARELTPENLPESLPARQPGRGLPLGRAVESSPEPTGDEAAVDLLFKVVAIPSPSGSEAGVARLLVEAARASATSAFVDTAGNAVAKWGRGPLHVTFLGHMDTVPGDIPVEIKDGVLHGRGAVDAKGSLCAALMAAVRAPAHVWDALTFTFIGAVEEESSSSRGAEFATLNYPAPHMLIVGEPSGWQRYTLGYKGRLGVTVKARRPGAHSSRDEASAAEIALDAYSELREWVTSDNAGVDGLFEQMQLSLTGIDTHHDGLEETCVARLSLRLPPRWEPAALSRAVSDLLTGVEVEFEGGLAAHRAEASTELARAFRVAVRATGGKPAPVLKTGTSDMNVVAPSWNVPMLAYGPGDSNLDHTPEERIELSEYLRAVDVLVGVFTELSGGRPGG